MIQVKKNWHYAIIEKAREEAEKAGVIQLEPPYQVNISCFFSRPKKHFSSKGELKPNAPKYCDKKPDNDNIEKTVYDALVKSGVIADDAKIVLSITDKQFSIVPQTFISINTLN